MYHDIRNSSFGHLQFIGRMLSTLLIMCTITTIGQAAIPVITSASANTLTNTLTVTGTNLLGDASNGVSTVTLANIALTVLTQTPTSITASFPSATPASSLVPGMYPLLVTFNSSRISASFEAIVGPQTRLLFSFVTNVSGLDTDKTISNISLDPTIGSPSTPGVCVLNLFSERSSPPPFSTPTIPGGTVSVNRLSQLAPGFQGYIMALCNFKAQGLAVIQTVSQQSFSFSSIPAVVNP